MGIVNLLKFSRDSGAMICDEESTYFERRRTHFDENVRNLLIPYLADKYRVEAIYGGAGYPPFHYEVYRGAARRIRTSVKEMSRLTVRDVARATLESFRGLSAGR